MSILIPRELRGSQAFLSVMNMHLVFCARAAAIAEEGNRLHQADLKMVLEEQVQQRLAGYIQGVIELYAEELEAEKKAARRGKDANESDTEMEDDVPLRRKKKGKRANGDAASKDPKGR
jgi:hypothetical protein